MPKYLYTLSLSLSRASDCYILKAIVTKKYKPKSRPLSSLVKIEQSLQHRMNGNKDNDPLLIVFFQLMEIVSAFGLLKAYHFELNKEFDEPFAFLEVLEY